MKCTFFSLKKLKKTSKIFYIEVIARDLCRLCILNRNCKQRVPISIKEASLFVKPEGGGINRYHTSICVLSKWKRKEHLLKLAMFFMRLYVTDIYANMPQKCMKWSSSKTSTIVTEYVRMQAGHELRWSKHMLADNYQKKENFTPLKYGLKIKVPFHDTNYSILYSLVSQCERSCVKFSVLDFWSAVLALQNTGNKKG